MPCPPAGRERVLLEQVMEQEEVWAEVAAEVERLRAVTSVQEGAAIARAQAQGEFVYVLIAIYPYRIKRVRRAIT